MRITWLSFSEYLNSINALNDNLPDDLLFDDAGGIPAASGSGPNSSAAPTSVVGSIAGGPQVVVASTMGINNGGSTLNGITTNCVPTQPMMTSSPQGMRLPSNPNINLVNALQGNPGAQQQGMYTFLYLKAIFYKSDVRKVVI